VEQATEPAGRSNNPGARSVASIARAAAIRTRLITATVSLATWALWRGNTDAADAADGGAKGWPMLLKFWYALTVTDSSNLHRHGLPRTETATSD